MGGIICIVASYLVLHFQYKKKLTLQKKFRMFTMSLALESFYYVPESKRVLQGIMPSWTNQEMLLGVK